VLNVYLTAIGVLAVALVFVSRRIRDLPLSEPLLALALGVVIGPRITGWVRLEEPGMTRILLEASRLLLAVSLVAIGLRYPLSEVRKRTGRVVLLLAVVMPGMAAVSALLGGWLLGLSAGTAWLLGACVSPTDPVLASSVVTGESARTLVPARLRQLLSMESGANDGLAFPLVVLGIVIARGESLTGFARESLWAVLGAVVIGACIGVLAGHAMRASQRRGDVEHSVSLLFTIALALFVLGAAKLASTDGILAVFVAGLAYNHGVTSGERGSELSLDEGVNRFVVLPMFTLFGVALPWDAWGEMGWPVLAFAVAVLFLRRLPLIAALRRPLDLHWPAALFYGWFGPIGASALFYLAHAHERGVTDPELWAAGSLAIAVSVIAHGVTAAPGRRRYARHADTDRVTTRG
jgi:NhaP-type Na+/H+ or K+/H+ antiporter